MHASGQPTAHRPSRPAFSLLELILVIFVLTIFAVLAASRYTSSLQAYRADLSAKRIAADLVMARNNAWSAGARRTVEFTQADNSYAIASIPGLDNTAAGYAVNLAEGPYYGGLFQVDFEGGNTVTFDGYGMPNRGGSVVVRVGDHHKTVVLDRDSGNVSVQ